MVHIYNVCLLHDFVATLKTARIALCIVFYFVLASTVTTSLQSIAAHPAFYKTKCLFYVSHFRMFHISVPIIHYSCHITEAEGEVGIP